MVHGFSHQQKRIIWKNVSTVFQQITVPLLLAKCTLESKLLSNTCYSCIAVMIYAWYLYEIVSNSPKYYYTLCMQFLNVLAMLHKV